jgi:hypothetical protein
MTKLLSYRGTEEIRELPFGLVHIQPEALNWLRGTRGELFMAGHLARLGPGWHVLHSVPVGTKGSDIDHIAIGPPGVFPINTKRLIGRDVVVRGSRFRSDGWKAPYLAKSLGEANRVIAILNRAGVMAPVLPVIAISGAHSLRVKSPEWNGHPIGVTPVKEVVRRLKKREPRLTADEVERATAILSDPTAWQTSEPLDDDYPALFRDFKRIDRGVSRLSNLVVGVSGAMLIALAWWTGSALSDLLVRIMP